MLADRLITGFDRALRAAVTTLPAAARHRQAGGAGAFQPDFPDGVAADQALSRDECARAAALMRVNHVGEVCAQALYHGQAMTAQSERVRAHMEGAALEEGAHLEWCAARIGELGGRTSLLNPAWYAGAFVLGAAAGLRGDATSLGFVAETERQVEAHLESHLNALPVADVRSRAIVERMARDEARHRAKATAAGGTALPFPARLAMKMMAKLMTITAYRI